MAFLFLAESEDSTSLLKIGSVQSPIVKTIDMLKAFYCRACSTVNYITHQSGMMCEHCGQMISRRLISSMEGSHARTLVLQELERAWKEAEAVFFMKSSELLAIADLPLCSWKTCQLSLLGDLKKLRWNSLNYGMIVDGQLYRPENLEPYTYEKDSGYLDTPTVSTATYRNQKYPTPTSSCYGRNKSASKGSAIRLSLHGLANRGLLQGHPNGSLNPEWVEQVMGYKVGWTEIKDWAMQWFQSKRKRHL